LNLLDEARPRIAGRWSSAAYAGGAVCIWLEAGRHRLFPKSRAKREIPMVVSTDSGKMAFAGWVNRFRLGSLFSPAVDCDDSPRCHRFEIDCFYGGDKRQLSWRNRRGL